MSHYDELLKALRAAAYEKGEANLAQELCVSEDTVRRMLGNHPPKVMQNLRRLEQIACRPPAPSRPEE